MVELSGAAMNELVTYTVVDRANQEVTLRLEIETSEGEKGDREIVLKTSAAKGDLRIAVISDFNGSFGEVKYEKRVTDLITSMPDYAPDFVICGGDMIAGQSSSLTAAQVDAMWAGFEEAIAAPLRAANIPFAFTMGNHDAAIDVDKQAAERYWNVKAHFPGYYPVDTTHYPFYQSFLEKENGDIFMVAWDASDANLSQSELDWVRAQFESTTAQNAKYRFIIGHLPLYAVAAERNGSGNVLSNADALHEMMEELDVHTYFSGHHHAYYPAKRGTVDLMNAGATGPGARQLLSTNDPAFNTFTLIDVFLDQDTLIYNTFELPTTLPEKLPLVDENILPQIIEGFNGFLIRRDLPTNNAGSGNLSPLHLNRGLSSEASGLVSTEHLSNDQLKVSGSYEALEGALASGENAIGIYQGQHYGQGELAFEVNVVASTTKSGTFETTIPLDGKARDLFAVGAYYVLIKTDKYPEGELRGQIYAKGNQPPNAPAFLTQSSAEEILIRDNQGVFPVKWEEAQDPERNPLTYTYQLSLDENFEDILVNEATGRTNFYQLLTEGKLIEYLKQSDANATGGTFYQRVVTSDGSNVTVGSANPVFVKITDEPAEGPIQILAPDYTFNENFEVFTTASNGHGIAVDKNGRIWHGSFASGGGFRVTNPDGTAHQLASQALTYSSADLPAVSSFKYKEETISVGNIRGMGADEEGFVLIVISDSHLYCFDPDSGQPVARWKGPLSFTNPTVDAQGRVFVASVVGNKQYLLQRNGDTYEVVVGGQDADKDEKPDGFGLDGRELSRSSAIAKNGKWILMPANSGNKIYVYKSENGVDFEAHETIESVSQGGTNSITSGDNGQFWYLNNRSSLPPMLVFRDFENQLSWSLPLNEITSSDQRGLAFSSDRKNLYTVSSADGSVINYRLPSEGMGMIPTYSVDQLATRSSTGTPDSLGVYARVTGLVQSINFNENGVDVSFGTNGKGMVAYRQKSKQSVSIGDAVAVVGSVSEASGLITIVYDSLRITNVGAQITYKPITTLDKTLESLPVTLAGLKLKNVADWTNTGNEIGFEVLTENNTRLYIDAQAPAFAENPPNATFEVYGVVRKSTVNSDEWALWVEGIGSGSLSLSEIKSQFVFSPNPVTAAEGFKLNVSSTLLAGNATTFQNERCGRQAGSN